MDRDLVNNQIVLMRKIVRNVKRFVNQKLNKQIKRLEVRKNKQQNKNSLKKLENKITNKKKELIAIKGLNVDEVSKQALTQTKAHFENTIKSSQTFIESKALARIANNDKIEKVVNKFKEENPNCDQWLSSQIELWEQKKLIKRNIILQKKGLINEENNEMNGKSIDADLSKDLNLKKSVSKTSKDSKVVSKSKTKSKNIESKNKNELEIEDRIETNKQQKTENEEKPTNNTNGKSTSDPFFLSSDFDQNEEQSDDNIDRNESEIKRNKFKNKNFKTFNEKESKFSKRIEKSGSKSKNNKNLNKRNPNIKTKRFEKKESSNQNINVKPKVNTSGESGQSLHPSWAAKRSVKDKFKIDLNQKPLAKKIKFNDN